MSILINEAYANETIPLWASNGGGGGGNNPLIFYALDGSDAPVSISPGDTLLIATFSIPASYNPQDNFIFNVTLDLFNIVYEDTFAPKYISVEISFPTNIDPVGAVTFTNRTPIFLTGDVNMVGQTINGFMANTGTGYSPMSISIVNGLTEKITFDYAWGLTSFQKVASGGVSY